MEYFVTDDGMLLEVKWENHITELSWDAIYNYKFITKDVVEFIHGKVLPRKEPTHRTFRVIDTRWRWWRLYWAWEWLTEKMYIVKLRIYRKLWEANCLATQEGYVPRWQDIRPFGWMNKKEN